MNYLINKSVDGRIAVLSNVKVKKVIDDYYNKNERLKQLGKVTISDDESLLSVLPCKSDVDILHPSCVVWSNSYYFDTKGYALLSAFIEQDGTPGISVYRQCCIVEDFHYYESKDTEKMIVLINEKSDVFPQNDIGVIIQVLLVKKGDTVEVIRFKDSDDVYILNGDDILDIETFEAIDNKGEEYEII